MANQRSYTDEQLGVAVAGAQRWADVLVALGKPPNWSTKSIKVHAERLGLDVKRFSDHHMSAVPGVTLPFANPTVAGGQSGLSVAAKWFLDRGYTVSVPMEPAPYDLITESDDGLKRVQVKTVNRRIAASGRFHVNVSRKVYDATMMPNAIGKRRPTAYLSSEVDLFFIVTATEDLYLIPTEVVNGHHTLVLDDRYAAFLLT